MRSVGAWSIGAIGFSALVLVYAGGAFPQGSEAPHTLKPDASCVTGECHAREVSAPQLHWDDLKDDCRDCHVQEDEEHSFSMASVPALCAECHEDLAKEIAGATNVHDPAEEDCIDCHDPHGSKVEGLLAADNLRDLCFECHDEEDVLEGEVQHEPVAEGDCTDCHDPHASKRENLLVASGSALCGDCHEVVDEVAAYESPHEPAEDDCIDCHHPHSSDHPKMLRATGKDLCNECHDDIVDEAAAFPVLHGALDEEDECLGCHTPHGSDHSPILRASPVEVCLACHDKVVEATDGSQLMDMRSWLKANDRWHEPISKKGCAECHMPHGGERARLLTEAFPPRFYSPFSVQRYALCFSCHDKELATVEKTRKHTRFRDGDENLHFLHVNKNPKGRTCRACHDMHAAGNSVLVRSSVRFGKWMMPIDFHPRENGGSCGPGCHGDKIYDREREVSAAAPREPFGSPVGAGARAAGRRE